MPTPESLGLPPRTPLLRLVEYFDDVVRVVRSEGGGPPRVVALVSRATALGQIAPEEEAQEAAAEAAEVAKAAEVTAEVEEVEAAEAPPSEATSNTRVAAARWPASELFKLPASLRPQPGQTLDLILLQKVRGARAVDGPLLAVDGLLSTRCATAHSLTVPPRLSLQVLLLQSRRGYRANTDSMLLPWYAAYRLRECTVARTSPSLRVADLGAGHGLVGILAALQWPHARVVLYERQASLAALARRNLGLNGLSHPPGTAASPPDGPAPHTHALAASPAASPNAVTADTGLAALPPAPRGTVIECDLATPGALNAHYGAFDIVLSNPPFYAPSAEGAPRKG